MRKIEIDEQPEVQRRWIAKDMKSGETLLRLHDRDLLETICSNLGWQIVETRIKHNEGRGQMRQSNPVTFIIATYIASGFVIAAVSGDAKAGLVLYRTEAEAQQRCPKDGVVWLDFQKKKYYLSGQSLYGRGGTATFVCRSEAKRSGYRRSLFGIR